VQVGCTINYDKARLWKGTKNHSIDGLIYISDNNFWVLRTRRTAIHQSGPVAQLGARFHGMEEVVGSIPTRSTNPLNKLDRVSLHRAGFSVITCPFVAVASASS
jgi:hypothetical protein